MGALPIEELGVDPVRDRLDPPRVYTEEGGGLFRRRGRRDDEPGAGLRPAARPLPPPLGVRPVRWHSRLDRANQGQLRPVELAHDRDVRTAEALQVGAPAIKRWGGRILVLIGIWLVILGLFADEFTGVFSV